MTIGDTAIIALAVICTLAGASIITKHADAMSVSGWGYQE